MIQKFAGAIAVLALSVGLADAEVLKGKIIKVDDKTVTFQVAKSKEAKTFELVKDVKVSKIVKKKQKEELTDGLKAAELQNISAKGIAGSIVTNDDNKVTEIIIGGKKKKKKTNN
jgi:hypothetical protein